MYDDPTKERIAAQTLVRLKDAALEDRKDFDEIADQLAKFDAKNYDHIYSKMATTEEGISPDLFFKAKINRVSEYREIVCPYLYPENPRALSSPKPHSRYWQRQRAKVEEDLLNYGIVEAGMAEEARRWIDQAATDGRGVLWVGWDPEKRITVPVFATNRDYISDPDARSEKEKNWVGRRRFKPRWKLAQLYPEKKEVIALLPKSSERPSDRKSGEDTSDLIEYWEYYFRVGLHNYARQLANGEGGETDDSPKKYVAVSEHILSCDTWDIPYFQDGMWPAHLLDPRPRAGKSHPYSPIEPGLGHLETLNYLYTLYISKVRASARIALVVASYNGQQVEEDQLVKLIHGDHFSIARIKINGNEYKINDLVQQWKMDAGVEELQQLAAMVNAEFEKATGLDEFLYAGQADRQARSATEADLREEKSSHRIQEMKRRTTESLSLLMRKIAFANRYLMTPEDVARVLGEEAGKVWGVLASPEEVAQEQALRKQQGEMLMQQAQMQQQMAMEQAAMAPPMLDPMGMPMPPPPPPPLPTPDEIEQQLGPEQLVSTDEWIMESTREIEAGSMRRIDHDAQIDQLNIALNQLAPAVTMMPGGPQFVAAIALEFTKVNRFSKELQAAAQSFYDMASMAPPPMPAPPADKGPQADSRNQKPGHVQ